MPFVLDRRRFVVGTGLAMASTRFAFAHGPAPVEFAEAIFLPADELSPSVVVAAHGALALAGLDELTAGRLAGGTEHPSWAACGIPAGRGAGMIFHVGDGAAGDVWHQGGAEDKVSVDLSSATARPGGVDSQMRMAHDIAAMLMQPGNVGVDYLDVCDVLGAGRQLTSGIGIAAGEDRAVRATHAAMKWLDPAWPRWSAVLVSIAFGPGNGKLSESRMAMNVAWQACSSDARLLYGTSRDKRLAPGEMRVSLVATRQRPLPHGMGM